MEGELRREAHGDWREELTRLCLIMCHSLPPAPRHATMSQVIVIGGGLAGLTTAHTVLECGGRVLLMVRLSQRDPPQPQRTLRRTTSRPPRHT
jgi:hypothetical protein